MSENKGCFYWLGQISWIFIWFGFTVGMLASFQSQETAFSVVEEFLLIIVWSIPILCVILINSKTWYQSFKNYYISLYIIFSIGLFNDEVLDQYSKLSYWILISIPFIIICYRFFSKEKRKKKNELEWKKHLEEKAIKSKKIQDEIRLKKILANDKIETKKKLEEIEKRKFNIDFIDKLKKIYSESNYTYHKLNYINKQTKVLVTCEIHGDFSIKPLKLASGSGCPKCTLLKYSNSKFENFESQIKVFKSNIKKERSYKKEGSENYMLKLMDAVNDLKKGQKNIKSDTSKILSSINKMMSEISDIKSLTKDTNESIEKSISKIISSVEQNHDFNTIEDYIPKVTEWFKFWDKIEEKTKTFMPGSEWLYDNIKSSDFQDFSPFVLYYCRALENELLKKIFLSFHEHVNEMNDIELKSLFVWNKEGLNEKKLKEYQIFFNQFKTNILKNRKKYTLGDMRLILNLLPNSKNKKGSIRYNISPLLKELNKFIKNKIGGIESETIKRLENLIINYRNKSAHVDIIEEEKALIFYNEFKIIMNKLIGKF